MLALLGEVASDDMIATLASPGHLVSLASCHLVTWLTHMVAPQPANLHAPLPHLILLGYLHNIIVNNNINCCDQLTITRCKEKGGCP